MGKHITMRDIATKLGVSSVTVSKALNDKEGVGEELKQKIKETAKEMGYRINTFAKAMKEGQAYNIGVIIPERFATETQSFYLKFYQHLAKTLDSYQYSGILHILNTDDEDQLVLPRVYNEQKVDGMLILGQISNEYINLLNEIDFPIVYLDFYNEKAKADTVITDNFYGMYKMTNYLIQCGHSEIGFIGNIYATSSIQDRFLGYYKSLLEHKLVLNQDYVVNDRDERGNLIELQLPEKLPTAFVCNCDKVAYHLINKFHSLGIKVPEDCSVVGFDNDIYAEITNPKLTTVAVDIEEMSKTAVDLMISKLKNKDRQWEQVSVKGKMIHRQSVKKLVE
ncbi:substrate-binding domain-containing protein [Metabacillus litoralis]|uniref:substrate-binding domain-containing protein n=1 Tax=Metabacillus litoralis TaxID=152268 RepID=UPI00203E1F84|nr:substrate-binding domain-containing protein [Metabacillus litoralis]MCM3162206.1 substrate-binding domain-containing protein [Metabacillus litoralis]